MTTITGSVGATGKYLVTGTPVNSAGGDLLVISFENNTAGTNLALVSGTAANFAAGAGGTQLSDSGGPGFRFLTIIDAKALNGQIIWVQRMVGAAASTFTLTVE